MKLAKIALTVYAIMALYHELDKTKVIEVSRAQEEAYEAPDPCGLTVVVCDGIGDVPEGKPSQIGKNMDTDHIVAMITQEFGDDAQTAIAIAKAESGLRPEAKGDTHIEFISHGKTMGHSCGVFQIRVLPGRPDCETLQNPEYNIKYAKQMYERSGWKPWSAFNNGSFKKYL